MIRNNFSNKKPTPDIQVTPFYTPKVGSLAEKI